MFSVVREYIHTIHFLNAVEIFSGTEQMCASFLNNAARAKIIGSFVLYIHAAYLFTGWTKNVGVYCNYGLASKKHFSNSSRDIECAEFVDKYSSTIILILQSACSAQSTSNRITQSPYISHFTYPPVLTFLSIRFPLAVFG